MFITLIFIFIVTIFSQNNRAATIPSEIQKESVNFLELIARGTPEEIYPHFDSELKREIDIEKTRTLISNIKKVIGAIDKMELIRSEYSEDKECLYSFLYDIETNGRKLRYEVNLKQTNDGIFVRGFTISSNRFSSDSKQPYKQGITILHLIVVSLFVICIFIQIWCVIYFLRNKELKYRWLYIILSFFGFPFGIGINWVTGGLIFYSGFKIPAVAISWPAGNPGMWSIIVCFPFGVIFLIKEMLKKKSVKVSKTFVAEEIEK